MTTNCVPQPDGPPCSVLTFLTSYLDVAPGMRVEGHAERHGVVDPRVGVDDQQPPLHFRRRRHHFRVWSPDTPRTLSVDPITYH